MDVFESNLFFQVHLDLTFNEAAKGVNKTIQIEVMDSCTRCHGNGNEPGSKIAICGYCGGSGMVSEYNGCYDNIIKIYIFTL